LLILTYSTKLRVAHSHKTEDQRNITIINSSPSFQRKKKISMAEQLLQRGGKQHPHSPKAFLTGTLYIAGLDTLIHMESFKVTKSNWTKIKAKVERRRRRKKKNLRTPMQGTRQVLKY